MKPGTQVCIQESAMFASGELFWCRGMSGTLVTISGNHGVISLSDKEHFGALVVCLLCDLYENVPTVGLRVLIRADASFGCLEQRAQRGMHGVVRMHRDGYCNVAIPGQRRVFAWLQSDLVVDDLMQGEMIQARTMDGQTVDGEYSVCQAECGNHREYVTEEDGTRHELLTVIEVYGAKKEADDYV